MANGGYLFLVFQQPLATKVQNLITPEYTDRYTASSKRAKRLKFQLQVENLFR